jgi:hypothetical protein
MAKILKQKPGGAKAQGKVKVLNRRKKIERARATPIPTRPRMKSRSIGVFKR